MKVKGIVNCGSILVRSQKRFDFLGESSYNIEKHMNQIKKEVNLR